MEEERQYLEFYNELFSVALTFPSFGKWAKTDVNSTHSLESYGHCKSIFFGYKNSAQNGKTVIRTT